MNIRPPAQIDWLVGAVGEQAALSFIECAGGRRLWVPAKWVGSELAATYGEDVARALAERYGGNAVDIPVLRPWRIRMFRMMGLSCSDIAARVGVDRCTVVRTLARGPRIERPRKSWQTDPGQMRLF